jgi:hypothetical protein
LAGDWLSNLFIHNLIKVGIKAKKKRLGGLGGGGGLPPISPFAILGKAHYSAQTNSGLTQPNLAFNISDVNTGLVLTDVGGNSIADYEVRDYITGTLRGIAADSYPAGITPNLNITLANTARNIDFFLYSRPAIYNPTGLALGTVNYTTTVVVDAHNLVGNNLLTQIGSNQVSAGNAPMFNSTFVNQPLVFSFNSGTGGGLPHPINSGELIIQITASVVTKSGTVALTTGNPANAAETTKQSFYLDLIVQ